MSLRPALVASITSAVIFAAGDITAQKYEDYLEYNESIKLQHDEQHSNISHNKTTTVFGHTPPRHDHIHIHDTTNDQTQLNYKRLLACTLFGAVIMGPVGTAWYHYLDIFVNKYYKLNVRPIQHLASKVILDTAIFNPLFLIIFFTSVSSFEGFSTHYMKSKLQRDFVPSYLVDTSIWPIIQTVNFRWIPVNYQLLLVNLFCFFDDVFISYVQHNGMPPLFQYYETWWHNKLGGDTLQQIQCDMEREERIIHPQHNR